MAQPLSGTERLAPIGLDALDAAAALRRRFDTKYLVAAHALPELMDRLEPTHRVLELGGRGDFEYRTTYFDTEQLAAFRDHLQGRRRRLKARVRHYVDSGACFFELKLRGPRGCTIKHRMPHDPRSSHSLTPQSRESLERWVQAAYGRSAPEPLCPALVVAQRRLTLVAPELGERLTIDLNLRMWAVGADGWGRLDPELAIVESKSARGSASAARQLNGLSARPLETMSKYCAGVVLAYGRSRGNALLPVLRHCTRLTGAAPAS